MYFLHIRARLPCADTLAGRENKGLAVGKRLAIGWGMIGGQMIYTRMASWQFHRAYVLGYRPMFRYNQNGLIIVAMKREVSNVSTKA